MVNKQQEKQSNEFYDSPADVATRAKVQIVSYYISLYLRIISNSSNNKIVYFDPFAGRGYFKDGFISVPYRAIKSAEKIDNVEFIFNDLYQSRKLEEFIKESDLVYHKNDCRFLDVDASKIDLNQLISESANVFAFIDSFSEMLAEPKFVGKILKRKYSDCAVFINVNEINRFNKNPAGVQKKHIEDFFGNDKSFAEFKKNVLNNSGLALVQKTSLIVKDYVERIENEISAKVYALPILFRTKKEDSLLDHIVVFLSKSQKGLYTLLNAFSTQIPGIKSEKELNFYIIDQHLNVYENEIFDQIPIFDIELEEAKRYLNYIPKTKNEAINKYELLCIIRNVFYKKYGYISCISEKYINKVLTKLEDCNLIEAYGKRRGKTFGENVLIYEKNK